MKHTYKIEGVTCKSCEEKIKKNLLQLPDIQEIDLSKETKKLVLTMSKHIETHILQAALDAKYTISELETQEAMEEKSSWFNTYKPVLLIFAYITLISLIAGNSAHHFDFHLTMRVFMGGFFLTFSFFKMLDLKGFSDSYQMYDLLAKKFKTWGIIYAFIELALGIAYISDFNPLWTNIITFIIMSFSIIGVVKSVLDKKKIKCACLGAIFNLPMSTLTIIEDGLMILMSAWTILEMVF